MDYIVIGNVQNTHGLQGHLKIKSNSHFKEERFKKNSVLYILYQNEYIEVIVKNHKIVKNTDVLQFLGYEDINLVERYKGCEIVIKKDALKVLDEDEFYFHELEGCLVYTDVYVGTVCEVREVPQGELLIVEREHQKRALIPFMKQFVKQVNIKEKKIVLYDVEGLL